MTNLDQAIRDALSIEDAKALEGSGAGQPLTRQLGDMFKGRLAWMNVIVWIAGFGAFGVLVYCGVRFVVAPDTREMLLWLAGAGLASLAVVMIKTYAWMELQKNAVLREIKRLELQVALMRRAA
jgi:hypothetical protein